MHKMRSAVPCIHLQVQFLNLDEQADTHCVSPKSPGSSVVVTPINMTSVTQRIKVQYTANEEECENDKVGVEG
jgi:hypothetical protein